MFGVVLVLWLRWFVIKVFGCLVSSLTKVLGLVSDFFLRLSCIGT